MCLRQIEWSTEIDVVHGVHETDATNSVSDAAGAHGAPVDAAALPLVAPHSDSVGDGFDRLPTECSYYRFPIRKLRNGSKLVDCCGSGGYHHRHGCGSDVSECSRQGGPLPTIDPDPNAN